MRLVALVVPVFLSILSLPVSAATTTSPEVISKWITVPLATKEHGKTQHTYRVLYSKEQACGPTPGERWADCMKIWDSLPIDERMLPGEKEFFTFGRYLRITKEAYCIWHHKDMLAVGDKVGTRQSCDEEWETFVTENGLSESPTR